MTFAFGGDALFLYYNTAYHTCHGSGIMLESMNYPFGESIFMTDAQGALSILLSKLNTLGIDTCTYSIGIVNGLIMYLLPLSAVFLFLIFKRFKVNILYASILSVAIAIMSPQSFRIISHYGLSYPFYIPMCIYWVLRKYDLQRWEWKDLWFIIISSFFYLNNPYIGFSGLLFIPLITFVKAYKTQTNKSFFYQYASLTSSLVLLGYLVIKLSDPFVNRIKEQNGFFQYDISFNGILNSKYGFANKLLSKVVTLAPSGFENTINFGLIPLIFGTLGIVYLIYSFVKKKSFRMPYPNQNFKYIFLGALLLACIACNGIIPTFLEEFIKSNFSALLLFKATGRFIWLAYFTLAIWSAWLIHEFIKTKFPKNTIIGLFALVTIVWTGESIYGFYNFNQEMSKHGNMFKRATNWKKYLTKNGINPEEFQGILALPIMQGWASKLKTDLHWRSQYESTTMALTSGLPLIDGMLSRMSLDHAMNIVQLGSDPLIYKQLIDKLPNQKPILVMDMSETDSLVKNQNYLLTRSQSLTKYKFFDMYRLELDSLRKIPILDSIRIRYISNNYKSPIHFNGFDNINTNAPYRFNKGSYKISKGENEVIEEIILNDLNDSLDIEISLWTLFTSQHEDTPNFYIQSLDKSEKPIETDTVFSQYSKDVKDNWVKITSVLNPSNAVHKIRISSNSKKEEIIDDLTIRYTNSDVVVDKFDSKYYLWNNYLIEKD